MTDAYTLFPDVAALAPEVPADAILSRTFYKDDRLSAVVFSFAPGQELSEHTSAYPAVLHFLSGRARLTLGSDETTAEAGTWVRMAPRLPHSVVAETPVVMLLLLIKN
jgi:quercetin dioxygenase-like cupin family protein